MTRIAHLRRLAADCRADHEKAPIDPDVLDALLDIVESQGCDAPPTADASPRVGAPPGAPLITR